MHQKFLLVTLGPCRQGNTICDAAEALIAAGVKRSTMCSVTLFLNSRRDPDPQCNGLNTSTAEGSTRVEIGHMTVGQAERTQ